MENCSGNHYETVVCILQPQTQSCYGYCKVNVPCSRGYNIRQRRGKGSVVSESLSPVASCVVEGVMDIEDDLTEQQQSTKDKITFNPLCMEVAKTLCSKCNVDFERQNVQGPNVSQTLGVVFKTDKVDEDNSFF